MVDDLNETTSLTREITYHLRSGRRVRTFFRSPNFVTAVRSCITFYGAGYPMQDRDYEVNLWAQNQYFPHLIPTYSLNLSNQ